MNFGLIDYGIVSYTVLGNEESYISQIFQVKSNSERLKRIDMMIGKDNEGILVCKKVIKDKDRFKERVREYKKKVKDDRLIIVNKADILDNSVYDIIAECIKKGIGVTFLAKDAEKVRKKLARSLGISDKIEFKLDKDPFIREG